MDIRIVNPIGREFGSVSGTSLIGNKSNENIIGGFAEYLNKALKKVSDLEKESQMLTEDFAAGRTDNIHQVMIAAEKAKTSLDLLVEIRNKTLDMYKELTRIQI